MEFIDNIGRTFKDDLSKETHEGSKMLITIANFTMYTFLELNIELKILKCLYLLTNCYNGKEGLTMF